MTPVRPMERDDLDQVAALYRRVLDLDHTPLGGLRAWFERTLFDQPWVDSEIPSLVAVDGDGRVTGALCSHVRRLRIDGNPARLAVSGQLVVAPEARSRALGALLMSSYLAGPQDLTITDGATNPVRRMWERLGGDAAPLQSLEWWRPLRPWRAAAAAWERRRGRPIPAGLRRAAAALDRAPLPGPVVRHLAVADSERAGGDGTGGGEPPAHRASSTTEPLTGDNLTGELPAITRRLRVFPDYDREFAAWLLAEMGGGVTVPGALRARLVRDEQGGALGYFVYYLVPGGISPVIAVAAPDEPAIASVLDALFSDARAGDAAMLRGRVEPRLLEPVARRRALFRYAEGALIHAANPAVGALAQSRHALVTRLEGEWWMAPHLGAG